MSSHATHNMHIDVSFKQRYIKYQSSFIFSSYKTISTEEGTTTACPNNGVTGKAPFDSAPNIFDDSEWV